MKEWRDRLIVVYYEHLMRYYTNLVRVIPEPLVRYSTNLEFMVYYEHLIH